MLILIIYEKQKTYSSVEKEKILRTETLCSKELLMCKKVLLRERKGGGGLPTLDGGDLRKKIENQRWGGGGGTHLGWMGTCPRWEGYLPWVCNPPPHQLEGRYPPPPLAGR